jgi:hypothetical protein
MVTRRNYSSCWEQKVTLKVFINLPRFLSVLFDAALIYQYYVILKISEGMWDIDGIILTGGKPKVPGKKPFPTRPFPPQTPHSVTWD